MMGKAPLDASPAGVMSEKEWDKIFGEIRQYSTIKHVLEGNSERVIFNKQRVKSIDCQIMSVLFEDVLRHKTVSKMEDENYIFIRRAIDVKTRASMDKKRAERAKLGEEVYNYVTDPETNVDIEDRDRSHKRLKHAVRKLVNLNTNRMMDVLGYQTTEKDARRLEYAIKSLGTENELL